MSKTAWGRKETIIWPRHMPIYTCTVAFGVTVLTFLAVCIRIHLATPLQRYCLPAYERSSAFGAVTKTHKSTYRLLFVGGPHSTPRPAMNDDVILGRTGDAGGQTIPLTLSADARERGYTLLFQAPGRNYVDARFSVYLGGVVFKGATLFGFFEPPTLASAILFLILLPVAIFKDVQRQKQLKYGRRLKGPEMLTPQQFNKTVKGDGVGFKTNDMKSMLRIPLRAEAQHMQIIGDTGAGKSALIFQVLRQVQSRGDAAIVYDPAREFVKRFYNPSRGDVILNPLDKRCP
jgi:Type IV secretion-system coupling protein DNA-binding domain